MSYYAPDRWVIVRIKSEKHPMIDKILGSWYGGYAGSDEWRMSSGVTKVVDKDTYYEVHNHSGSIYELSKQTEGMSAYTGSVYARLEKQLTEEGLGTIEIINIKDLNDDSTH